MLSRLDQATTRTFTALAFGVFVAAARAFAFLVAFVAATRAFAFLVAATRKVNRLSAPGLCGNGRFSSRSLEIVA